MCGDFAVRFLQDRLDGATFAEATDYNVGQGKKIIKKWMYLKGYDKQTGEGILRRGYEKLKDVVNTVKHRVKDVLENGLRKDFPPSVRAILEKHGDEVINDIIISRVPVKSYVTKILDWVSSGKFSENIKSLNYDTAFHLMMKIRTTKSAFLTEKNEVVKLKMEGWTQGESNSSSAERIKIHVKPGITLKDLFQNAVKKYGIERITHYSSHKQNCQLFIHDLLSSNSMWNSDISKFIMQDAEGIYKDLGYLKVINQGVTDLAHSADIVINGEEEDVIGMHKTIPQKAFTFKSVPHFLRAFAALRDQPHFRLARTGFQQRRAKPTRVQQH